MRPETVRQVVNQYMSKFYNIEDDVVVPPFPTKVVKALKRLHSKSTKDDKDARSGYESYGYGENDPFKQYVKGRLRYISDRWHCRFRLRWLLDGIVGGHFS